MTATAETSNAACFAELLKAHAAQYYPEFVPNETRVRLRHSQRRPFGELYQFTLQDTRQQRDVFVKVPFLNERPPVELDRPRLFPPVDPENMAELEYTTMRSIERHFGQIDDARFGVLRVFDLLDHPRAIVMEQVDGVGLRTVCRRQFNSLLGRDDLSGLYRNIGGWLRRFHNSPSLPHTVERSGTRDDFLQATGRLIDYARDVRAPAWLPRFGDQVLRAAETTLPPAVPLGLTHGDFAPRNVIVSENCRVTVLDTLGRWRAPIYEDLGLFLMSLRLTPGWRVLLSSDSALLSDWSRNFLAGYFGQESEDWPVIRLFICQALLDRWCSYISQPATTQMSRRLKTRGKLYILKKLAQSYLHS